MIFYQRQNGSITERKFSSKKTIHINSRKISNNKPLYKRKSYINKKNDNYKNRTINVDNDQFYDKFELNKRKNKDIKKIGKQLLKTNFKDFDNYNKEIINKTKENKKLLSSTCRCYNNIKEEYLSKFFNIKNKDGKNYQNIKIDKDKYDRVNSKNNKFSRNNINNFEEKKYFNKSYIIKNKPIINLENELNYEFEIRLLKEKLKELYKANNKLKLKIFNIKTEQNRYKQKNKKENIISKVIQIDKKYAIKIKKNSFKNDIIAEPFPALRSFKNMLLNIMDWKYSYENKLMIEQFFIAVKSALKNNDAEINYNNLIKYIKIFINKKIEYKNKIDRLKYFYEQNQKYQKYLIYLCELFKFQNLEELEQFLKNTFYKYNQENKEMKKFKNIVLHNIRNKNLSLDKMPKFNIDNHYNSEKILMKNNNSEININSRNFKKIYESNEDSFHDKKIFYTFREYRQSNKNEKF